MGNALVDVIAHADDRFLATHGLVKGSMTLVDEARVDEIHRALDAAVEMSGGSAANTACGVASLGGRAAYIGKVDHDALGDVFGHDMRALGVSFTSAPRSADVTGTATGRSLIVVTPDAERTMNTYLGMSSLLGVDDVDDELVASGKVLYMEGYLFDRDAAKAAFRHASDVAHRHGRTVALTLSDSFCVDRHRSDFRDLVRDSVDVLFGNHDELLSLFEVDSFDEAVAAVRRECDLAVITVGADGCVIVTADAVERVPAVPVERVVDTTGAGDLFAAGFLHGMTTGRSSTDSARLGAIAAAEVISHVGPRPLIELRRLAASAGLGR
jgi:sugar/nucleoside kinase (ribokinase family)